MGCCKYCAIFFPILLALYFGGWRDQPQLVRQVGKTSFAKPENYKAFTLTDQHREEFFRDGATLLKGVLTPAIVAKLHEQTLPFTINEENGANVWMLSDELLDFYLFGPLGSHRGTGISKSAGGHIPSAPIRSDAARFHQPKASKFYLWMAY